MSRENKKTDQKKSCQNNNKLIVKQFCENTSIHGLKYIFEDGSILLERLIWLLVFLCGVCFSSYFCVQMWHKWEESPVLTSVETQLYPLNNIYFPAVTICNVNKVSKRKLLETLKKPEYADISYQKMQLTLRYMTKLDRAINNERELKELNEFYKSRNISALDLFKILEMTAPSCSDIIMDCNWLGLTEPCMEYFSFLPTDDGMCCTFNSDKYFDSMLGIEYNANEPLRVNGNGYRMGLNLVIDANVEDYSVTTGKFDGFKVLVHGPEEFPDISDRAFVLGPGTETFVAIKGTTTFNTEDVAREVTPIKRQCLVEGEKKLKYYRQYSRSACFVDCKTRKMQEDCNCRPYFFREINDSRLCEMTSYTCISDVNEKVRSHGHEICECLPPCTDTRYDPEISYASFPGHGFNLTRTFKRLVEKRNLSTGTDGTEYFKSNVAILHVYYKEKTGMRYRTDIRFGIEDFISAMGGLLGLGLGMSFISVIELFYFFCVRRFFLRHRAAAAPDQATQSPSTPPAESDEAKNVWPSSTTLTSSIKTVESSLDGHSNNNLVRRGSLNLPADLQATLFKY
ncbi:pickpocket protein 28-like [Daphnia pulex]|uniref:pickpocket protein 28-like n=1 Tax=Daphnia pulex TaxID=6669 RepID=UPI001EDD38F4|nr:pickpocket protein 28-like [Daphnia pulex]